MLTDSKKEKLKKKRMRDCWLLVRKTFCSFCFVRKVLVN